MDEKTFKIILDGLWASFMKANCMLNILEGIGVSVSYGMESGTGLSDLYGICDKVAATIVDMFGSIEHRDYVVEKVNEFLLDVSDNEVNAENCSMDKYYDELVNLLKANDIMLPWEI